jgi:hypothetical protein
MRKIILLIIMFFGMTSCGSYVNVSSQPRITHILAVNELGQEVQVPLSTFSTGLDPYFYHNWRFYWGNTWYWGNNWWFYFNDPFWRHRINNFYYSHPVYYNNGYRIARNNGYRGRNSIINQNVRSSSTPRQNVQTNQPTRVREHNSVRTQTSPPVRSNQPQRSSTTRGGGRRGG